MLGVVADERVELVTGDVVDLISRSENRFESILLDVDNGPNAMTDGGNRRLYGRDGILACRRAVRGPGCLAQLAPGGLDGPSCPR